jgi:hypothetical protein
MKLRDQERLQDLTRQLLEEELAAQPWLAGGPKVGIGFCEHAAVAGMKAARQLGLRTKLRHGAIVDPKTGRELVGYHTWLELAGGVILDSPAPGRLVIGTAAERGLVYRLASAAELKEWWRRHQVGAESPG